MIRGCASGVGSELALACDTRFASRERAVLSQWEVGAGLVPGSGPMARLPRLIGRGRALEVLLGADDITGDVAELYGYVNRALPDHQLDAFVDAFAAWISSFDKRAIVETKRLVNVTVFLLITRSHQNGLHLSGLSAGLRLKKALRALFDTGFHAPGDLKTRLGYHAGSVGFAAELSEGGE